MTFRPLLSLALALCLSCLVDLQLATAQPWQASDPLFRDSVTTTDGGETRGRLLERYHPDHVVLYRKTNPVEIPHKKIKSIRSLRDDLATFMRGHRKDMSLEEEWRRVQEAIGLNLPNMAEVQAWRVLALAPQHEGANEHLEHPKIRKQYRWVLGRKKLAPEEYGAKIKRWQDRIVLESAHYILETNTSVLQATNILYDLEFTYLHWMKEFGEELQLGEDVYLPTHKMTFHVFNDRADKGFTQHLNSRRDPFYDPSSSTTTRRTANPNLAFTYYIGGRGERPSDFFNLAVQQLMYSTLVLPRRGSFIPTNEFANPAHWIEIGMGYWFGRQLGGPAGFARPKRFVADSRNRELATRKFISGPLSGGSMRRELINLISLERRHYYSSSKDNVHELYRAKARSFFRYLVQEDPPMILNNRIKSHGREGLMRYLREVYIHPTDHSSKSFDNALGGKVELYYEGWVNWRK